MLQAWDDVSTAIDEWDRIYIDWALLENGTAFNSELFMIARTLVRMADEDTKRQCRSAARISAMRTANRWSSNCSPKRRSTTIWKSRKLGDSLSMFMEQAGADNEWVRKTLQGKSPQARADELVRGTRLKDVAVRKKLAEGGRSAIEGSNDPMILLARLVDPPSREVRKTYEEKVDEPMKQAYAQNRQSQFRSEGNRHLSRRHVYAPPGVRPSEGLQARWQSDSAVDHDRRRFPACR